MIDLALSVSAVTVALLTLPALYRAAVGPTTADRLVAVNVISTKVIVLIGLVAAISRRPAYVDIAFVYGMIGFVATVAITRYLEHGKLVQP